MVAGGNLELVFVGFAFYYQALLTFNNPTPHINKGLEKAGEIVDILSILNCRR
ncbi:MAG: hypothetical protein LBI04_08395 [Treponema sp.]|jgi:hypothetical protein|nr:hypothetical protein [Treponema sp.]